MAVNVASIFKHVRNAFLNRDPTVVIDYPGSSYYKNPDRPILTRGNEKSILASIVMRIAIDVALYDFEHCQTDKDGRYEDTIKSPLHDCLSVEANIDQSAFSFKLDMVLSMLDEGVIAAIPIVMEDEPNERMSYDIFDIRVGKILEWKPQHIKVWIYNELTGEKEELWWEKRQAVIIENPLYSVMNEHNSMMQRLKRKLSLLDVTDEKTASGKLDMILQLPYSVKSKARKSEAKRRLTDMEEQLAENKYGIAYIDGTEKITQLNRPIENNLMKQIEYLMGMVFSQLGMTQSILDGTADEQTMLNYYNRTVIPIVNTITEEMRRKWLSQTARSKGESIMAFRDPLKGIPAKELAELADKFTRNEITSSNEIRSSIGMKPSKDPKADMLVNSNISQPNNGNSQPINIEETGTTE